MRRRPTEKSGKISDGGIREEDQQLLLTTLTMDLIVGRLSPQLEHAASTACQRRGLRYSDSYRSCAENIGRFDIFNLATLDIFHEHIFRLDGLPNTEGSIAKTRFRNLPFYVFDIWLPVDFEPTPDPEISEGTMRIPLLSCQGLLRDLEEIRKRSHMSLGSKPEGYDCMRENPAEFYRSKITLSDNSMMVQWVWMGLRDAAELALNDSAPLLAVE